MFEINATITQNSNFAPERPKELFTKTLLSIVCSMSLKKSEETEQVEEKVFEGLPLLSKQYLKVRSFKK